MVDTMTSWFSVSDALTRVAVMVCVVCVTGGQLGAVQETIRIRQCSAQGWMDVLEYATPYFACQGFDTNQTIIWRIYKNNIVVANSTCAPTLTWQRCSRSSSDIEVYRLNRTHSQLYIMGNHRNVASNGRVDCYDNDNTSETTCRTNVISPAVLSHCEVTVTTHQTLAGICNFNNAYSSNGTYTCTWTLKPTDRQGSPDITIPGDINKTEQILGSKLYYKGTCSFTRQIPGGQYTYTVRFVPRKPNHQYQGSVNVPVPPASTESTSSASVPSASTESASPTSVPSVSTESTSPTSVPSASTASTNQTSEPTSTKQPADSTDSSRLPPSQRDKDNDGGVPLGAVIGGAVAAVVVIAVVVIVVFIVIRRKRQKEDTGKDRDEDSDFEMHVNSAYVSAGELDQDTLPHQQPSRPSAVALCIPSKNAAFTTTSPAGRPTPSPATANHNTDNDYDYSTVEDEGDDTMDPAGYSSVSLGGATRPSPGGGDRGGGDRERPGLSPTTNADNDPSPALAAADVDYFLGDDGDYSSVDLHDNERPNHRHENRFGGLGGRGGGRHASDDEDMVDVGYSEVGDIARKNVREAPGNRGNVSGSSAADNIYAKVDKSSQRRGLQPSASSGGADDMYAKVDKSSQRRGFQPSASGGGDACDDVGNMYARVNKSAPRFRPAAPEDDVRAELAGPPSTTVAEDDAFSDDYSHLNQAHTGRGGAPAKAPPSATFQPVSLSDLSSFDNYAHLDHGLREREDRPALEEMRDESGRDVYVQVDKSSNGNNLTPSPPVPASRVYQHPPKPKPAVRPKPAVKPKPVV